MTVHDRQMTISGVYVTNADHELTNKQYEPSRCSGHHHFRRHYCPVVVVVVVIIIGVIEMFVVIIPLQNSVDTVEFVVSRLSASATMSTSSAHLASLYGAVAHGVDSNDGQLFSHSSQMTSWDKVINIRKVGLPYLDQKSCHISLNIKYSAHSRL